MTVRTAELLMAIFMLIASIGIMVKAAELNIGWVPGRGPGAGAWPFWLGAGMAVCCVATLIRWARGETALSRSLDPFIEPANLYIVAVTTGALVALLLLISVIGMYFALMLFVGFYVRVVGHHSWFVTLAMMIGIPVFVFGLFEWALTTSLPKGLDMFEPLYYPLYDIMYAPNAMTLGGLIFGWIALAIVLGALEERAGRNGTICFAIALILSPVAGAIYHYLQRSKSGGDDVAGQA